MFLSGMLLSSVPVSRNLIEIAPATLYASGQRSKTLSEDLTQNLPQASFEERVLTALSAIRAELSAVHTEQSVIRTEQSAMRAELSTIRNDVAALGDRLTALEDKVDRRLQETRPLWEGIQEQIRKLDTKFDIVIRELYEIRYDHVILGKRVDELEKTISR
jgi:uncharacterized protein (DUF3084 family)